MDAVKKEEVESQVKEEPLESNKSKSEDEEKKPETDKLDPLINEFFSEIDEIKQEDFKSTSKEQIDRLMRPGSTYFNLNPFEVLQIDPYASIEEIKKKYRKLSMYVHPDKNAHDIDRAIIAFEAVNRAYKLLEDDKERKKCLEVVDEARERVDQMCEEKRKKAKKDLQQQALSSKVKKSGQPVVITDKDVKIDEDDPDKYRHAIYVLTCKLFADIERLKVKEMEKKAEEKKRKAEEKNDEESKSKVKKEWDKNYEDSREGRVSSWKNFVGKKSSSAAAAAIPTTSKSSFKPPKHKPETR